MRLTRLIIRIIMLIARLFKRIVRVMMLIIRPIRPIVRLIMLLFKHFLKFFKNLFCVAQFHDHKI